MVGASLASGTPFLMGAFDVRKMSDDFRKSETSLLPTEQEEYFVFISFYNFLQLFM